MKPSWKDAPEWANYLAMDKGGMWCWFEGKPSSKNCLFWHHGGGRTKDVIVFDVGIDWEDTLEQRPKESNK